MNKNTKITLITLALLAVFGIGGAFAVDSTCPINPEIEGLSRKAQEMSRPQAERQMIQQSLVEIEEARWQRCTHNFFMSKAEKASILEQKKRGHEAHLREMAQQAMMASSTATTPPVGLGIAELEIPPQWKTTFSSFGKGWNGYIGKKMVTFFAGSSFTDPMQGMIVVSEENKKGKFLLTPTATGPVKIVAEKKGVLTLKSIAGEFGIGIVDGGGVSGMVSTPGGETYYFDMKTRTFR